ncbi:unnamed protein product, partial [Phaeothamnion confervicola]
VNAVKADSTLKVVDVDVERLYLRAEAKSAVPPTGIDDIEFLIKPDDGLVTYRTKSRDTVFVGPLAVSDGGSNRNSRLEGVRSRLGWPEAGLNQF